MSEETESFKLLDVTENEPKPKRNTFITVLCVLSFIYVGFGILGVISNVGSSKEEAIKAIDEQITNIKTTGLAAEPFGKDMISYFEATKNVPSWNNTVTAILLLLEGLAVFLIFQLKRNGFWIYSAVQLGFIAQTISVLPFPNMMSTAAVIMTVFIVAVFQILYAVNLKHLKN